MIQRSAFLGANCTIWYIFNILINRELWYLGARLIIFMGSMIRGSLPRAPLLRIYQLSFSDFGAIWCFINQGRNETMEPERGSFVWRTWVLNIYQIIHLCLES